MQHLCPMQNACLCCESWASVPYDTTKYTTTRLHSLEVPFHKILKIRPLHLFLRRLMVAVRRTDRIHAVYYRVIASTRGGANVVAYYIHPSFIFTTPPCQSRNVGLAFLFRLGGSDKHHRVLSRGFSPVPGIPGFFYFFSGRRVPLPTFGSIAAHGR